MAIDPTALLAGPTDQDASKRIVSTDTQVKTLASIANSSLANTELLKGTVVSKNTTSGHWQGWDQSGANGTNDISGIVWPNDITLHATKEVVANIMLAGKAHYVDLIDPDAAATEAQFKTALSSGDVRKLGIYVHGLVDFA